MASKGEQPSRLRGVLLRRTLRTSLVLSVGLLAAFVFLMGGSAPAAADTPVSGTITVDTTWNASMSPIWVEGDVLVTSGATLTIDPGVEVRFNGYYDITVADGAMVADGDAGGAGIIRFTSNFTFPFAGAWDGIYFNGDLGTSMLDDVEIQWASTGLSFNGASVPVSNTQILDSQWYGVYVWSSSVLEYDFSFTGCTIANAGLYGMYFNTMFDTNLSLQVSGCTFSGYGSSGLRFGTLQWADFDIRIEDSSFNASNRAVTFDGTNWADADEGNFFRFTFNNNWLNSSFDFAGVYL
ncbi:MAG: right-handed parallel beta-helix repeat-containing protein, partial [Thermoplasmata archaeon]|nr:right-handed parallel beta-helix repeat-containing protein [Thermoplasmata archaeon]